MLQRLEGEGKRIVLAASPGKREVRENASRRSGGKNEASFLLQDVEHAYGTVSPETLVMPRGIRGNAFRMPV